MLSTRRFAALFAIGAAVAVPIVGCGGSSDDSTSNAAATPAPTTSGGGGAGGTVDLSATDFKFTASDPSV